MIAKTLIGDLLENANKLLTANVFSCNGENYKVKTLTHSYRSTQNTRHSSKNGRKLNKPDEGPSLQPTLYSCPLNTMGEEFSREPSRPSRVAKSRKTPLFVLKKYIGDCSFSVISVYMEKSCHGNEGHSPSRVNCSEHLQKKKS